MYPMPQVRGGLPQAFAAYIKGCPSFFKKKEAKKFYDLALLSAVMERAKSACRIGLAQHDSKETDKNHGLRFRSRNQGRRVKGAEGKTTA